MAAKLASSIITFILCIAFGVVVLATMLIAMNGYSESDSTWGLGAFVLLAFAASFLMAVGAYFTTGKMQKKKYKPVVSSITSILIFSIVGLKLEIVSSLIGIGIAEFVRANY